MTKLLSDTEKRTVGSLKDSRPDLVEVLEYVQMMLRRYQEMSETYKW